jgi:hypothetical protein
MTGFIFGDIVGSVYENRGHSALPDFELFHIIFLSSVDYLHCLLDGFS